MEIIIAAIVLVAIAVVLLGIKIFFVKGGKFPNTHIHGNKEMRRRGITCAQDEEFYNS